MALIYQIKTFPQSRFRERVELSGALYELVFTWRRRTQGWYLDVYRDDTGDPVVLGRRIRSSADAFGVTLDIEGALVGGGPDYPTVEDMDTRFFVFYITADDE